ncbi:MAG TPA: hypothetical protein VL997_04410 [Dyella sp.]|nr:hypothetical protein [Dyella sp.]
MAGDDKRFMDLAIAVRFATWVMPPHRRDWAAAMLNEIAYVRSRRAAWHWVLGCTLFAIRERTSYELVSAFTPRGMLKALFKLSAVSFMAVIGLYMIQKPYQRERILIAIFHHGSSAAHPMKTVQ